MNSYITTQAARVLAPREASLGTRLPYAGHVDAQTVRTRDGLLVQTLHLAGFPFETASDEELNYRKAVRETMLRGVANSRFALYHHIVRREVSPELTGEFAPWSPPPPFTGKAHWRDLTMLPRPWSRSDVLGYLHYCCQRPHDRARVADQAVYYCRRHSSRPLALPNAAP